MLEENADLIDFAEQQRQEDDDRGECACQGGDAHFLNRLQGGRCGIPRIAQTVAENAFRYHHGVVDQHADGQHHAHHGQHVERQPREVHGRQRDY